MSLNLVAHGQSVGINTVPTRGLWDVQDGPLGLWLTQNNTAGLSEGGLRGLHLDRPASDLNPHGLMWSVGGTPMWGMGMDFDSMTYPIPDMILLNAKPGATSLDYLRCRQDTGQVVIGFGIGHPGSSAQLQVNTLGPGVTAAAQFDGNVTVNGTLSASSVSGSGFSLLAAPAAVGGPVSTITNPNPTWTVNGFTHAVLTDASTNLITIMHTLYHLSSGTPATGFGSSLDFAGHSSTNTIRRMGRLASTWKVATDGSTNAQIEIDAALGTGLVPCILCDGTQTTTINGNLTHAGTTGAGNKLAFFNVTPVLQQANASQGAITSVTDANAKSALQAIYNLLVNYGLAPATA